MTNLINNKMKNLIKTYQSISQKLRIDNCKLMIVVCTLLIANCNYAQSLDSLLQLVVENNPELKSLQLEYEAELLKVDQVSQLPNPEIGVGIPVLPPETRLGPQILMVSASQMFPWFGTFKSTKEVVISMSKAKYERISAVKLNLYNTVKVAYYQLNFLNEKANILSEFLVIYKTLESVSLAKVESGQSTTADVLRIQLKLQEFEQELKIIENQKLVYNAQINNVTNQSFDTKIKVTDDLSNSPLLQFNLDDYQKQIKSHHPLMLKIDNEIEVSKNKQMVNSSMNKPKIGVGIDYSLVGQRTDANPEYNGRDIFIPKVKVSIPIYRKSYRAKNEQEEKFQESLEMQKLSLENKMLGLLLKYKSNYDNAILKVELNQQQIETTQMAYEVLLSKYSSNGKGFDDLLQIQNQLLNYQLGLRKEKLNIRIAQANIERLTNY